MKPYEKIIQLLREKKINYTEINHAPVYTCEQASQIRGIPTSSGMKSLLLKFKFGFILLVLPGNKKLDSSKLKTVLGIKKFRFATPDEVREVMGCEIGACYPFGNLIGLTTYADKSLEGNDMLSFNPGVHDKTITISWDDYNKVVQPQLVELT